MNTKTQGTNTTTDTTMHTTTFTTSVNGEIKKNYLPITL